MPRRPESNDRRQELPDVELRNHNGRPTIFVGDKPTALSCYSNFNLRRLDHALEFFQDLGMDAYSISVDESTLLFEEATVCSPTAKQPKGKEDKEHVERQVERILARQPEAYLYVRFGTRPPATWLERHPEECVATEAGDRHYAPALVSDTPSFSPEWPSFASDVHWKMAAEYSAAVVRYCESRPWARNVVIYGNYHNVEGSHWPAVDGWLFDHSELMLRAWRTYLKDKYRTVGELRSAYGDKTLTFQSMKVPTDALLGTVPEVTQIPYWQAGAENRALRDYLELTRDLFLQRFRELGEAMAGAVTRKVLFLHDALKQTMLGWNLNAAFGYPNYGRDISWSPAYPEVMAGSGHMNVAELDGAPGYDGLVTPHDYQVRGLGGVYEPEGIVDSTVLRGMYFSCEMDTRFRKDYGIGAARDIRETEVITWRNIAAGLTRGFSSYMCWGFQVEDWFYTEPVKELMKRQADVMRQSLDWQHDTVPGIAMILDDSAVLETNGSGNYFNEAIMWEQKMGMARCGVPFRIYLLEDLALANFPKHRLFYFPNLFRVDDKRLKLLKSKVFRDGNIVVWGPGSGISDGERIGPDSATRLTGFKFDMLPANAPRRALISNFDHPITDGLDAATVIGGPLSYGPILLPTDGTELGLAWAKGGMNHIGLSIKEFGKGAAGDKDSIGSRGPGDYAAVFTTAVNLPADLWRNMARYAGAHVYCETNDVLMADSSVVAIHSLKPGKKLLSLPGVFTVYDLMDGRRFADRTRQIACSTKGPDTRLFLLRNAKTASNGRTP